MARTTSPTRIGTALVATALLGCPEPVDDADPPAQQTMPPAGPGLVEDPPSLSTTDTDPSDSEIAGAVELELADDRAIPVDSVAVHVVDGIVTLTGTVPHLLAKQRARRLAEVVLGVRAVSDRVEVQPQRAPIDGLAHDVERALLLDPAADAYEIVVSTEGHTVALAGTVESWQEKQLAVRLASGVRGVARVVDELEIDYDAQRSDAEILEDVEQRLHWDALVDDGPLHVEVDDGAVTLTGIVGSAAERSRAHADAWVAGVHAVETDQVVVQGWARDEHLRRHRFALRTDADIADAINAAARIDPRVGAFEVAPTVLRGVVTLRGEVDNLAARRAAVQLARSTVGVSIVNDELTLTKAHGFDDAQLETHLRTLLALDPITLDTVIEVDVEDGHARLSGTVLSWAARNEAEDTATRVSGITSVDNDLVVDPSDASRFLGSPYTHPYHAYPAAPESWPLPPGTVSPPSDPALEASTRRRMQWSPFVDAEEVEIDVQDGKVTLRGVVDSISERDEAVKSAYEAGASLVDDDLRLEYGLG